MRGSHSGGNLQLTRKFNTDASVGASFGLTSLFCRHRQSTHLFRYPIVKIQIRWAFALFISLTLLAPAFSQTVPSTFSLERSFFERQSQNEAFDSGLTLWNVNGRTGSVSVIDWTSLPSDSTQPASNSRFLSQADDSSANNLGKAIKMSGATGLWQYVPVNGKSARQALHCNARKRLIPGRSGATGWASFGVFYYDAGWNEVGFFEDEILEEKSEVGYFDGLNFYSQSTLGCRVPASAKHAIIWIANDGANTETYADDLILLNLFDGVPIYNPSAPARNQLSQDSAKTNLVANSSFSGILPFDLTNPVDQDDTGRFVLSNRDFYWKRASLFDVGTLTSPRNGFLRGATSSYWQEITVVPQQTYLINAAYGIIGTFGAVGVDLYDANWNRIGTESLTLDGAAKSIEINSGIEYSYVSGAFTTPTNVKYASAYIWRAGGEGDIKIVHFSIAPVIATATPATSTKVGKVTASLKKQSTAAARASLRKNATR